MFCNKCGAEISNEAVFCPKCGCATGVSTPKAYDPDVSPKSRLIASLLCFFFGSIGVHRFYLGKIGTGIAMIFTLGGLGVWSLIDLIILLCGSFKDNQGKIVSDWQVS